MQRVALIFLFSLSLYAVDVFHGSVIYINNDTFRLVWNNKEKTCTNCKNVYEIYSLYIEPDLTIMDKNKKLITTINESSNAITKYDIKYEHAGFYSYAIRRCSFEGTNPKGCDEFEYINNGGCFYADIGVYHQSSFIIFWKLPPPTNINFN